MKRNLESLILHDLNQKIVLLTGPRQCGKTTLAKQLTPRYDYFNYDAAADRLSLQKQSWDRQKELIIFDELHKMPQWKRWLKGIYDTEGISPFLLVTGSAKLDTYKKVGDSLAGRYFQYRMHPFDLKEFLQFNPQANIENVFATLWQCSGFPEPFLKGSETYYKRWRKTHLDIILRQDLIELQTVSDIKAIETLVELLKQRVGSTVSYANLARDIERDPKTVKKWLEVLENLYIIFRVTPYSKNISRSLLKEPKYYFYDHTYAENENARLENIVANALLKECDYLSDVYGIKASLHFLRTKDGKEIDFLILQDNQPTHLVEVKNADDKPATAFNYYKSYFQQAQLLQLVHDLKREKSYPDGLEIRNLAQWLSKLKLAE
jgi:uncharacterized protein